MGIDRVCCVDLHCGQIQGFFGPRTPVDNLYATPIALSYFATRQLQNIVVVSPDAGGVARVRSRPPREACNRRDARTQPASGGGAGRVVLPPLCVPTGTRAVG